MKKRLQKWSVLLLSFAAVFMLTVPALAASGGGALLNVKCVPGDTPEIANGLVFDLYKVADAVSDGSGGFTYTLTEGFAASGVSLADITNIIGAGQNSVTAQKTLLRTLAAHINALDSSESLRAGRSTAEPRPIGASQELTQAVAQFTDLDDGLYLVASQNAVTVNNTTYTPIPFLLNLPYEMNGVRHTYVTAHVKFDVSTPGGSGGNPDPGPNPPSPPNPPTPPTPPDTPTPPTTVEDPTPPAATIEDPEVPLASEPVIEVLPDPVPLTELPEGVGPEVEVPEGRVPLSMLPQTGLLWWPVYVMAIAGGVLVAVGLYTRKKARQDA